MKQVTVINKETGYNETFYNLSEAKSAMRENNAKGYITKIWANGDFENAGEIILKGTNKTFFANTRQIKINY